jgi:tetratricopeptide (TPR) repeat protein
LTPGRNDPCLCGSGKKFKKCCALRPAAAPGGAGDSPPISAAQPDLRLLFAHLNAGRHAELEAGARRLIERHQGSGVLWKLLGAALFAQGKNALAALQTAAELMPRDPESYTNLGNALRAGGRLDGAVKSYRKAIAIKPDFVMSHNNLALTLLALGRFDEAASSYRRVLKLRPDLVDAHNNLGNALRDSGHIEEAAASYRRALAIQPGFAKLHNNLGNALLDLGRIEEAAASYLRALELEPDFAKAHSNLGSAFRELGRLDEAEASYRRALAIQADSADVLTNLGVVQRLQGRAHDAEISLRRALDINPGSATTLNSLAELHADRGQFAEAENLYKKACAVQPDSAQAWAGMAGLRKMTVGDAGWISEAKRIAQRPLRPRDEAQLRYAIGKYFDDVQEYTPAFLSYRRANEVAKTYSPAHDRQHLAQTFDFITQLYDGDWLERARVGSNASARPVFIVGMPRSGTSLAEQILASHPDVFGAGELPFWKTASLKVGSAELQGASSSGNLEQLAGEYLRLLVSLSPDAARVVDKMPGNFAHLGMIHAAIPEARFIHMRRNPIDTCLSIYFQNFHIAHAYAHDLEDLAHYYDEYRRLMRHWRSLLPQGAILDVPYEGLVSEPEMWSRKMLEFVGMPWDAACIDFHQTHRRVSTFSKWQVRQKISKTSVERWRNYAGFVGPLMRLTERPAAPETEKPTGSSPRSFRSHISV